MDFIVKKKAASKNKFLGLQNKSISVGGETQRNQSLNRTSPSDSLIQKQGVFYIPQCFKQNEVLDITKTKSTCFFKKIYLVKNA